jgi:exonuclease VII small subunit
MAGVKSDDVEEAMKSLNRVVEKLEYLDTQVAEFRSKEQF